MKVIKKLPSNRRCPTCNWQLIRKVTGNKAFKCPNSACKNHDEYEPEGG
jgi:ssDNA-binding Zn-finger/Zn-ribbon topoisomerase 1